MIPWLCYPESLTLMFSFFLVAFLSLSVEWLKYLRYYNSVVSSKLSLPENEKYGWHLKTFKIKPSCVIMELNYHPRLYFSSWEFSGLSKIHSFRHCCVLYYVNSTIVLLVMFKQGKKVSTTPFKACNSEVECSWVDFLPLLIFCVMFCLPAENPLLHKSVLLGIGKQKRD